MKNERKWKRTETLPEELLRVIDPTAMELEEVAGAVSSVLYTRWPSSADMMELLNAYGRIDRRMEELAGKNASAELMSRIAQEKMVVELGIIEATNLRGSGRKWQQR